MDRRHPGERAPEDREERQRHHRAERKRDRRGRDRRERDDRDHGDDASERGVRVEPDERGRDLAGGADLVVDEGAGDALRVGGVEGTHRRDERGADRPEGGIAAFVVELAVEEALACGGGPASGGVAEGAERNLVEIAPPVGRLEFGDLGGGDAEDGVPRALAELADLELGQFATREPAGPEPAAVGPIDHRDEHCDERDREQCERESRRLHRARDAREEPGHGRTTTAVGRWLHGADRTDSPRGLPRRVHDG